jgi:hypothetical protein
MISFDLEDRFYEDIKYSDRVDSSEILYAFDQVLSMILAGLPFQFGLSALSPSRKSLVGYNLPNHK